MAKDLGKKTGQFPIFHNYSTTLKIVFSGEISRVLVVPFDFKISAFRHRPS